MTRGVGLRSAVSDLSEPIAAVLKRPGLWLTALYQARVLAAPGWWRRRPFLPLPDPAYLRFRVLTAQGGDGTAPMSGDDVISYLQWCRASRG